MDKCYVDKFIEFVKDNNLRCVELKDDDVPYSSYHFFFKLFIGKGCIVYGIRGGEEGLVFKSVCNVRGS